MTKLFSLLLALGLIGFTAAGCGKDAEADTAGDADATEETAATDDASESSGGGEMASLQRELNEIILGIETTEDVEAADPKIGAIFDKMAATMKASADDPAMAAAQNDPEAKKLEAEMSKHIEEISTKNPEVGMALAGVMLKHSDKLMKAAADMMKDLDISGDLDEASKALEEASKELDKIGN